MTILLETGNHAALSRLFGRRRLHQYSKKAADSSAAFFLRGSRPSHHCRFLARDHRMPVQRRIPTQAELETREKKREERSQITDRQIVIFEKLYTRDKEMADFILALQEHYPWAAAESVEVLSIAKAVRKPFKRTCELLLELAETDIGGPGTKRMILDEDRPFNKFRWYANLQDLIQGFTDKMDASDAAKAERTT